MSVDEAYDVWDEDASRRPSKSQLKRADLALQALAAELADLPKAQWDALALPEAAVSALAQAANLPPSGARKRQLKYVGGLFRDMDIEPIQEKLAQLRAQSAASSRELHTIERWRDRLIHEGDTALEELLHDHPHADRQQLRQLIRSAQREAAQATAPKAARQLFRQLRALLNGDG